MSLLSSGIKGLIGGVKTLAPKLLGKTLGAAIPGIGTALTIGSLAYDAIKGMKPAAAAPMMPIGGGGMANYSLADVEPRWKANHGNGTAVQWRDLINSGALSFEQAEQMNWQLPNMGSAVATASLSPMPQQMGVVPGWGQLAKRAAPLIAAGAKKWIPRILATGATVWTLVDAAGNVFDTRATPPRRRMNVLNPRALGRAHRRMDGFRNYAAKAMRHYGYTVSRTAKPKSKKKRRH